MLSLPHARGSYAQILKPDCLVQIILVLPFTGQETLSVAKPLSAWVCSRVRRGHSPTEKVEWANRREALRTVPGAHHVFTTLWLETFTWILTQAARIPPSRWEKEQSSFGKNKQENMFFLKRHQTVCFVFQSLLSGLNDKVGIWRS